MDLIADIHKYLADDIAELNKLILNHMNVKEELIAAVGKYLIEAGGKRIRPVLTILSSKLFGYKGDHHLKLATAIEFIHAATLLHDDVVDDSKLRRFKPTANTVWGNKVSILVGDFLFSQSFKLIVATHSLLALNSLSIAAATIIEGEIAQLAKLNEKRIITQTEYYQIITAKTGELFGAALEVGAVIAEQKDPVCKILYRFGLILGKIFQSTDDLLDYFGNNEKIGKNIGVDFIEGKVTLPLIFLHDRVDTNGKIKIEKMIQSEERNEEDFTWICQQMEKYSIKEYVISQLETLKHEALALLKEIPQQNIYKDYLLALVDFMLNRSY